MGKFWTALAVYRQVNMLRMLLLGFSAGLPLLLVLGTLGFWLREAGIDRASIGHLSWIGLAYGLKWVWAPLVDRLNLPLLSQLGRRRSWLLLSQGLVLAGLLGMAFSDPKITLAPMVWCALLVAFASATQDIALDAYRIESAKLSEQAALAASYQTGYRLAMIWAGAGVLWLAASVQLNDTTYDPHAWRIAYTCMALSMLLGMGTVLLSPEKPVTSPRLSDTGDVPLQARESSSTPVQVPSTTALQRCRAWLQTTVLAPFADFFTRYGRQALLLLALIALYRISDIVMGIMANPFYVDMGFTKSEVATVTKLYGVLMTLLGAFIGGALAPRLGVMRLLMLGAVLSAATNLLFVWLSSRGRDVHALIAVVSADNLASGLASSAFVAYLSSLTSIRYTATQYALFSSLMLLLPKFLAGYSGDFVDAFGYAQFFSFTALLGAPVLLLVYLASRVKPPNVAREAEKNFSQPTGS